jgi:hypothetical protein
VTPTLIGVARKATGQLSGTQHVFQHCTPRQHDDRAALRDAIFGEVLQDG